MTVEQFMLYFVMMPSSIISIILIYFTIAKKLNLSPVKKILFSTILEILYYVIIVGYIIIYRFSIELLESIASYRVDGAVYLLIPTILGLYTLYLIEYKILSHFTEDKIKKKKIALITIIVFLIMCLTPFLYLLYIMALAGS